MTGEDTRRHVEALLRRVSRELREPQTQAWLELDLTMAQLKLLFFAYYRGPSTVGQMAAALGVTLPSVSATINRLVRGGHLERCADPSDRRVVINRVTARGSGLVERLRDERRARISSALDRVNTEDMELLERALRVLASALAIEIPNARPQTSDMGQAVRTSEKATS